MRKLQTETVAYPTTAPWSGNGSKVNGSKDVADIVRAASIDWTVTKEPLFTDRGERMNRAYGLIRSTDRQQLAVVGERYKPVQNVEAFEIFRSYLAEGGCEMDIAGSLAKGRLVWGMARLGDDFKLSGGDKLSPYLFLGNPHGIGRSLTARIVTVRDVCNNTLQVAMRDGQAGAVWRMTHASIFDLPKMKNAHETIDAARIAAKASAIEANKMAKKKITDDAATDIITKIFGSAVDDQGEKQSRRVNQILDAYRNAPGAMPGNAWGLMNAVTYYADHIATRNPDARMTSSFIGINAGKKNQVKKLLLEMV